MTQNSTIHDLLIIGGGINGVGIAADAAGRGLDVVLCETNDLASATSSASTKLIHGGLRYLEHYEFSLVRKALAEREVLLRNAPHIITPMRFQLPHMPHLRPRWLIRLGLYLYDFLSSRSSLPASRSVHFGDDSPLQDTLQYGFEYYDAWVDDARLVVLVAMQARTHGAQICVRKQCIKAQESDGLWQVTLKDTRTGALETLQTRAIVNAAGPWVEIVASTVLTSKPHESIRLVKGCHIVVPRLFLGDQAFLLQNSDNRVVFAIPYEDDFTLIGTTEEDLSGDPAKAAIADWEIDYLLKVANTYFKAQLHSADVVHVFAGVRPLLSSAEESASEASRDYTLDLDISGAPLLSVYGGKITTYRRLAENALEELAAVFPKMGAQWSETAALPGGDFTTQEALRQSLKQQYSWLPDALLSGWITRYGTLTQKILADVESLADLGREFGSGLYQREVDYLVAHEWAVTSEDILWRRTKLGLRLTPEQRDALEQYLQSKD